MHEAGHALMVLATPLRDYIDKVRIFQVGAEWQGEQCMNGCDLDPVDPGRVLEFAKGLAGPLTHLNFYPNSTAPALRQMIQESGGLLRATRAILDNPNLQIQTNWWPDLEAWRILCLTIKLPDRGKDFLAVETEIQSFLNTPAVRVVLADIQQRLLAHSEINRPELLGIKVDHLPALNFPTHLSIFR